jgi:hypothetical protein
LHLDECDVRLPSSFGAQDLLRLNEADPVKKILSHQQRLVLIHSFDDHRATEDHRAAGDPDQSRGSIGSALFGAALEVDGLRCGEQNLILRRIVEIFSPKDV